MEGSNITIAIAFAAGLLSFLSPCVLPLVPGYLSLISGVSVENLKGEAGSRSRALRAVIFNSLAFNVGLSVIFVALGAAAGWVGAALTTNPWVRVIGGVVIIIFGLQMMGVLKIGALYRDTRKFSDDKPAGPLGAFALGMAFAAGWTPCIGPVLGGIIGLAATSGGWQSGLVLSAFYAAGLAVPFLLTGLLLNQFLGFYTRFRRHLHKVEVVSGVMLIVIGLLVATGSVTRLASYAASLPFNPESWVAKYTENKTPTTPASSQGATGGAPAAAPDAATLANLPTLPETEFKTLEGQPFRLNELRGRVVLLNFWATWCGPCKGEIPHFNDMQREHGEKGFTVVGVTSDPVDTPDHIRSFHRENPQAYTVLTGPSDTPSRFQNGAGLPVTYIVDREGRVRHKIFGPRDRAGFDALVLPLLAEPAQTASR